MPEWLTVVLLGIIEGITEFLPISSTGHLLIAQKWVPRQTDLFNIVIQSAAVVAVIPLFRDRVNQVLFQWKEPETQNFIFKIAVAFFVTGMGGVLLDHAGFELPETVIPVAAALFVGGILFLVVERVVAGKPKVENITWTVAIAIGFAQLIAAVFPGASRSGTTIIIAMILGLSRPAATEFSFLVGIPTMLAAGALKIFDQIREPNSTSENWSMLALGCIISAAVSFIAVKWLLRYVQGHTFDAFGIYRLILAIVLFFVLTT
jgi:undecaprenyl-diphosphatase